MSNQKFKSIKIQSELFEQLHALENEAIGRESFQSKIKRLIGLEDRALSEETIAELRKAYDNNADNLDAFIKSIIIDYKASKMDGLSAWTKEASANLLKSGMKEETVLECSEFEKFYDNDPKSAVMSLYVAIKRGNRDG